MRTGRYHAAIALWVALAFVQPARAEDGGQRVVVLDSVASVPTRELVTALRVQLGASAHIDISPDPRTASLADRFAYASSLVASDTATLVVWIERTAGDDAHDDYIVYAVGSDPSRALVEVVRVAADDRAITVRIMALKVAGLLDVLLRAADPSADFAQHLVTPDFPASYTPVIELSLVGSGLGGDVGVQGGAGVGLGVRRSAGSWALSARAIARWLSGIHAQNDRGAIDIAEIDVALGLRVAKRWLDFWLGADLQLGTRFLGASAVAFDGRTDEAFVAVPAVGAGLEAGLDISPQLVLRLKVGVETFPIRQRFFVLHQPAADLGRFRAISALTLSWGWP